MRRLSLGVALAACLVLSASAQAARVPRDQLVRSRSVTSLGTRFERFQQRVGGVPVLGGDVVVTDAPGVRGDLTLDRSRRGVRPPGAATVTRARAIAAALGATNASGLRAAPRAARAILPVAGGGERLVWRVLLASRRPLASYEALVDARSGTVVRVRDVLQHDTGSAKVFMPNAVVANGSRSGLSDNGDADSALLTSLRSPVTLQRLDSATTGCLKGRWVHATLPSGEVCMPGADFTSVTRADDAFEAVMAYVHVDRARAYLESLGFTSLLDRSLPVLADAFTADNAFYDPNSRSIQYGSGGVDDGEDGDVIVHEYGHALQDAQVPGFGASAQAGAIGEGFGDYLQAALDAQRAPSPTFNPCFAEWDTLGAGDPAAIPCLRRTDGNLTAAQAATACHGDVHCVGEAWSGALWSIRGAIGGTTADRLVVQSQYSLTASASFNDGSVALIKADRALYGGVHEQILRDVLGGRGLVDLERLDDTPADATPLAVPGSALGTVQGTDQNDVYRLSLKAGHPIVVRATGAGDVNLWLLRPGAGSLYDPGAILAGSTGNTGPESFRYTPGATGDYALDVGKAGAGGAYRIDVTSDDQDDDGVANDQDNCPAIANADQHDFDEDNQGDACDRSALVTLSKPVLKHTHLTLRGQTTPASIPASAWRVDLQRRSCHASKCRYVHVRDLRGARRSGSSGRVVLRARLRRAGRYRLRAILHDPTHSTAKSATRSLRVSSR